jgi:ligand-binding sensor domain-containing protein
MKKLLLSLRLFLFFTYFIYTSASAQKWTPYLSVTSVNVMLESKAGVIWVGSEGGLVCYNFKGEVIAYYTKNDGLPDNRINCIMEDKSGSIWAGTPEGIAKFDGTNWTKFDVNNNTVVKYDISSAFCDKNGVLWFGDNRGIINYDGKIWTRTLATSTTDGLDHAVFDMIQDKNGIIWAGLNWGDVYKYDGKTWNKFVDSNIPPYAVTSIFEDKSGKIWFGSNALGVINFDGTKWVKYTNDNSTLPTNGVYDIFQDKDGFMWVTTSKGVAKFDGTTWITFNKVKQNLINDRVNSGIQTSDGSFWFGTPVGISKFDSKNWTPKATQDFSVPSNNVNASITDKNGNLIFGTENGIGIYDGKNWSWLNTTNSKLASDNILSLYRDKDNVLWVGTDAGLSKFDGTNWTTYTKANSGIADNYVNTIMQDKDGVLWFGTINVISKFDGKTWSKFDKSNGFPESKIEQIIQDKDGNIWVATSGGLIKYDSKTWTVNGIKSGLSSNAFQSLLQDKDGNIWAGTSDIGLYKYDGKTWKLFIYDPFNGTGDLQNSDVKYIYQDKEGNIWIAGTLTKFDGKKWTFFNQNNTPITRYSASKSVTQDAKGGIWVSTNVGVYQYYSDCLSKTPIITSQAANQKVSENQSTSFQIAATDVSVYQWQNSKDKGVSWQNILSSDANYTGQNTNKITITSPKIALNDYQFRCVLTNGCASFTSTVATLNVTCTFLSPSITKQASNQDILEGQSAIFELSTNNVQSFEWQTSVDKGVTWKMIASADIDYTGQNTAKLTLTKSILSYSNYKYRCLLGNGCASSVLSDVVTLTVKCADKLPTISVQPKNQTVVEKSVTTFDLTATDVKNYIWQISIDKGVTWQNIATTDNNYEGTQTNSLKIKSPQITQNDYRYRCQLLNGCVNSFSNPATLLVTAILAIENEPKNDFVIYPNPSSDILTLSPIAGKFKIFIIDMSGNVIKEFSNANKISITDLIEGSYVIKVESEKSIKSQRLIIRR